MVSDDPRVARPLAIVGPTASGKSSLALAVARAVPGTELVTVDSMQVYRGMDIGTASPTAEERREVPHHLVDIVAPSEEFSVTDFVERARRTLADIRERGAFAVLVGGTGLYLRAIVDDLRIPAQYPEVRAELETEPDTGALHGRLEAVDPVAAARMEPTNRRRVVRALEVAIGAGRPFSSFGPGLNDYPPVATVQVGVRWPRDELDARIRARYDQQLAAGFLDEVGALDGNDLSRTAAHALGYRELLAHLAGEMSLDDAIDAAVARTVRFARRQERWFRRDPRIRWFDAPADAAAVVAHWGGAAAIPPTEPPWGAP